MLDSLRNCFRTLVSRSVAERVVERVVESSRQHSLTAAGRDGLTAAGRDSLPGNKEVELKEHSLTAAGSESPTAAGKERELKQQRSDAGTKGGKRNGERISGMTRKRRKKYRIDHFRKSIEGEAGRTLSLAVTATSHDISDPELLVKRGALALKTLQSLGLLQPTNGPGISINLSPGHDLLSAYSELLRK